MDQVIQEKPADWDEHYEWPYDRSRRICMKFWATRTQMLTLSIGAFQLSQAAVVN
jgi:hypothetical protein